MARKKDIVIAGMNVDAWLDTDSESIKVPEPIQKKYLKKIVAFLDLLAMKDLILNRRKEPGEEKEALEIIDKIKGIVEIETKMLEKSPDFVLLHISDSFIFTCSECDILSLVQLLATIQMRILTECHFQLRGAITYGDVYVANEGKQIVGPAYIDAYLLQENNAIYPRIILHNSFLEKINELFPNTKSILMSIDTEVFIDYLEIYLDLEGKKKTEIITNLKREHVYNYLIKNYIDYNTKNLHSIKQKYGWTMTYFKNKGVWPNDKQYNDW